MYIRTTEESILLAKEFIVKNDIVDEDLKQDIYITALESKGLKSNQQVNRKMDKVIRDNINKDDIYTTVGTSTALPFDVFETIDHDILHNQLDHIMDNTITEREKKILELRYVDGKTQKEIGELFHLTGSRIGVIEHHTIRRLRHPSRLKLLDGFLSESPAFPMPKNNYRRVEYN